MVTTQYILYYMVYWVSIATINNDDQIHVLCNNNIWKLQRNSFSAKKQPTTLFRKLALYFLIKQNVHRITGLPFLLTKKRV